MRPPTGLADPHEAMCCNLLQYTNPVTGATHQLDSFKFGYFNEFHYASDREH